jgi:hypothetical protein
MTIANSTVSENFLGSEGNSGAGIVNYGRLSLVSSTISQNQSDFGEEAIESGFPQPSDPEPRVEIAGTVIDGKCTYSGVNELVSNGHNVESEQNTCGLDHESDQVNVSAEKLALGPLRDNGGTTMTHALGEGSVAIDQIPADLCVDADGKPLTTDQRGFPRDAMCDTGAFEVQP